MNWWEIALIVVAGLTALYFVGALCALLVWSYLVRWVAKGFNDDEVAPVRVLSRDDIRRRDH